MSVSPLDTVIEKPAGVAAPVPETLEPVLSAHQALGLKHLLLTGLFGGLFMAANYVGLRPTDLWCHVAYGRWILEQGTLPRVDPFLANSAGMTVMDGAWLSQVLLAKAYAAGGGELLSTIFSGILLLSYTLLFRAIYLRTGSLAISTGAIVLALAVGWSRLWTIRPEMFGTLCFSLLLWLLAGVDARPSGRRLLLVAAAPLFALWVNLHGSFVCGLAVIYCYLLGAAIQAGWRCRNWRAVLASRRVRRWLVVAELATLGSLLNPYGMDLLVWTLAFAGNTNMRDVLEWQSLSFTGVGGIGFALSIVTLLFVLRHSRRRLQPADVLLIGLFGMAAMIGVRMIGWYAAVLIFVLAPHVADIVKRWSTHVASDVIESDSLVDDAMPKGRSFRYTFACLLMAWISFALSPASQKLLGETRTAEQLYQDDTPLELTEYLRKNPPQGRIFNPQHWGDWIVVDGHARGSVFATTMIHNLPARVWQDYMQISAAGAGWERLLQKYTIDVAIIDKKHQPLLASVIKRSPNWRVRYEDERAMVAAWRAELSIPSDE